MDTRFWGPPAWILLHSLAYFYQPSLKEEYTLFFENLKYILPCIYCRRSFTQYIDELPIDLTNRDNFFKWLYLIHNKVNAKLRGQGLLTWEDPSLEEIRKKYSDICRTLEDCKTRDQSIMGWNFLYCVAFVYPDNPEIITTQLRHSYLIFFTYLGKILPSRGGYREYYEEYMRNNSIYKGVKCRDSLKDWVYGLDSFMNKKLHQKCSEFIQIEDLIESYRAGCGGLRADKKPTCRRIRGD